MLSIEQLREQYPLESTIAGPNPIDFLDQLLVAGKITYSEYNEYLAWYYGEQPAPVVEEVPSVFMAEMNYPQIWQESGYDHREFVAIMLARGYINATTASRYITEVEQYWQTTQEIAGVKPTERIPTFKERFGSAVWNEVRDYLQPSFEAVLRSVWEWIKATFSDFWDLVKQYIIPPLKESLKWLDSQFEDIGRRAYDGLAKLMQESGPITPERAPALAFKVYAFAFSMGLAAHGAATLTELLHPLKRVGVHQISAMLGDFAGFSRIAAATMGVYTAIAIAQPLKYAVSDMTRSLIPDDKLLQIMAVKPDIDIPTFRRNMAYQGYSDFWIDRIQRTMFHEPRYFELKMMSEDEAATDEWLYTKSRRAGFNEADSKIMVSSYVKSATRTQRMDYYHQAFYLYREGYIDPSVFKGLLDGLELRPDGAEFARRAADLAYLYDYTKDFVSLYLDQFAKDLISEDSLRFALVALGMRLERADLLVRKAVIKKQPKPTKAVTKTVEPALTKLQTKYVTLYTQMYRKDLIDEATFLGNLLQLGVTNELAEVIVAIEEVKKFKPAPAE